MWYQPKARIYELLLVVLWLRYSVELALVYIASDEALKLL